jgi:hypothetical protein
MFGERHTFRSSHDREAANKTRGLQRTVGRMKDGAAKVRAQTREVVTPFRLEAVLAQSLVLGADLDALLRVGREP